MPKFAIAAVIFCAILSPGCAGTRTDQASQVRQNAPEASASERSTEAAAPKKEETFLEKTGDVAVAPLNFAAGILLLPFGLLLAYLWSVSGIKC